MPKQICRRFKGSLFQLGSTYLQQFLLVWKAGWTSENHQLYVSCPSANLCSLRPFPLLESQELKFLALVFSWVRLLVSQLAFFLRHILGLIPTHQRRYP